MKLIRYTLLMGILQLFFSTSVFAQRKVLTDEEVVADAVTAEVDAVF